MAYLVTSVVVFVAICVLLKLKCLGGERVRSEDESGRRESLVGERVWLESLVNIRRKAQTTEVRD